VAQRIPDVPVYVNNRLVYVPEYLRRDVCRAIKEIKVDYIKILRLKKELILNQNILIELL